MYGHIKSLTPSDDKNISIPRPVHKGRLVNSYCSIFNLEPHQALILLTPTLKVDSSSIHESYSTQYSNAKIIQPGRIKNMEYPTHAGYNFTNTIHNDIYPATDPTKSDLFQPGKVVLITGSGRGIGRSVAMRYAEAGVASLVLCARTASQLDETEHCIEKIKSNVRISKYVVDVTNADEVVAMANFVLEREGRLDVLINNAGMTNDWDLITVGPTDMYLKTWDLHIKGTYLILKHFLPLMVDTSKKHNVTVDVINTSTSAIHFVMAGASAYQASKFGLARLTEFVAVEYADQGVNCLSLHPGGVPTGIASNIPEVQAAMIDTAELCAGAAVWITKGQRAWLNGRYVSATWDVDELEAMKDDIVEGDKLKFRMAV